MKVFSNKIRKMEKEKLPMILVFGVLFVIVLSTNIQAHENFNETKKLIDSNVSCSELSDEQLNEIGDYYMEQMHPGESHELMHQMMGGEDSETVKLMHVNMAKNIYCGENSGMMGMMSGGMMGSGMMGSGMMGGGGGMMNMMTGNVMGSSGNMMYGYNWNIYNFLYLILLIGLVILVILIIIKLLKDLTRKNKR